MSLSIDGFVSGPNGEMDWIFRSSDETSRTWVVEKMQDAGLLLMGRKSFEGTATYWPTAPGPFAVPMNEIPKAVFTQKGYKGLALVPAGTDEQSPAEASWAAAKIYDGDLAEEIRKLKAEPGKPIYTVGGAGLVRSLIAAGLIDEYYLAVHPVALGSGISIFDGVAQPMDLKLVEAKAFPGGVVVYTYNI